MNNKPMISVIMLSYNFEAYVEEALLSVIEQQSDNLDVEILIVDDGSSDGSQKSIQRVQEQYPNLVFPTFKEHAGITSINKNINEQIKKSRGEYIAFLAGDDKYVLNRFTKQLEIFDNSNILLSYSMGKNFNAEGIIGNCQRDEMISVLSSHSADKMYDYIINNIPSIFMQGMLARKELLTAIGGFDEEMIADDWILNIRMFEKLIELKKEYRFITDYTFLRRMHGTNTSQNFDHQIPRVKQVIEKYTPEKNKKYFLSEVYINNAKKAFIKGKISYSLKYFSISFKYFPQNTYYMAKKIMLKIVGK